MGADCRYHNSVVALEQELLSTQCRADRQRVSELLHPDFLEFGASGRVWTRDAIITSLAESPTVAGDAGDFRSHELADGVVLLTYRITGPRPSQRSSVWVLEMDRWQLHFHQGTLIAPRD